MPFYFPFSRYPYSYQYRNRRPYYPPHPAVSSSVVQDEQEEGQRQSKGQVSSQTQSSAQFYARPHAKYQEMRNCKQPSNSHTDKSEGEKRDSTSKNRITPNGNTISNLFSFLPSSIGPLNFHPEALNDIEEPLFEMFGISLYLDDIIIVCILIFLYQEGVKDDMLYISLFLLLIS